MAKGKLIQALVKKGLRGKAVAKPKSPPLKDIPWGVAEKKHRAWEKQVLRPLRQKVRSGFKQLGNPEARKMLTKYQAAGMDIRLKAMKAKTDSAKVRKELLNHWKGAEKTLNSLQGKK